MGARQELVDAVRALVREHDEGRAGVSCMAELKRVLAIYESRLPQNQHRV